MQALAETRSKPDEERQAIQTRLFELPRPRGAEATETYVREPDAIVRSINTRSGQVRVSRQPISLADVELDLAAAFDLAWLRSTRAPDVSAALGRLRILDLFSGCGALTLGIVEACRALQLEGVPVFGVDTNAIALDVYKANFPTAETRTTSVTELLDRNSGERLSTNERELRRRFEGVEIAVGGPPCQGNSDLNNHTRRKDPKNLLFLRMARLAEVIEPDALIVENVPGVLHDRSSVVERTRESLEMLGYHVDAAVIDASSLGVPQRRRRLMLVASRRNTVSLSDLVGGFGVSPRPFQWACNDLASAYAEGSPFDSSATHSPRNQERIDFLFDNDLYDLPDSERPDCHRLKSHSYRSVYGRISEVEPAPTITSGFGSTGQGRFVHANARRTITPHEAARLQFIPDFFRFAGMRRRALQEMIGNAVPPKLAYVVALEALR
jgi:DNA (cytosine-5)-methyltransferase 1